MNEKTESCKAPSWLHGLHRIQNTMNLRGINIFIWEYKVICDYFFDIFTALLVEDINLYNLWDKDVIKTNRLSWITVNPS